VNQGGVRVAGNVRLVQPGASATDRRAHLLGDVGSPAAAVLLASRLEAEGLGARASGSEVWVAADDLDDALVMARLFREVDAGTSRVAPVPTTFWFGSGWRRLAGVLVLALLIVPTVFIVLAATGQ
jgi:hypothetical protein